MIDQLLIYNDLTHCAGNYYLQSAPDDKYEVYVTSLQQIYHMFKRLQEYIIKK